VYAHNGDLFAYRKPKADTLPPPKREGKRLRVHEAMGGGPVLVRKGKKFVSDKEEFFTQIAGLHPRTAIGITPDRRLVLLVADGRQPRSEGLSFDDLAELMLGLGVRSAINLDGGGSSTLTTGTAIVNKPSDANGERKVASAIIARRRVRTK
jgi:exopolysaccharide biosynthesis protein